MKQISDDHQKLLALVEALPDSYRQVELAAGITKSFLYQARQGECEGDRSVPSWERLRAYLVLKMGPERVGVGRGANVPVVTQGLLVAIRKARLASPKRLRALSMQVAEAIAVGEVPAGEGRVIIDALREARQCAREAREMTSEAKVKKLIMLTPEEETLLEAHRKEKAGPPLEPGVSVPPPA